MVAEIVDCSVAEEIVDCSGGGDCDGGVAEIVDCSGGGDCRLHRRRRL